MDNRQQVMVVTRINLDEHIEVTCCIVAFCHLWYLLQFLQYMVKIFWVLQIQANVGTGLEANFLWVDDKLRYLMQKETEKLS